MSDPFVPYRAEFGKMIATPERVAELATLPARGPSRICQQFPIRR